MSNKSWRTGTCSNCKAKKVDVTKVKSSQICEKCLDKYIKELK